MTEVAKTLNEEGIETEIFWIKNKPNNQYPKLSPDLEKLIASYVIK